MNINMLWPILVVIGSNTVYNICAKQTNESMDTFFSLIITYGTALIISTILFFTIGNKEGILAEASKINWVPFVYGLCIVGLEFGYINVYRVGWKVSVASLVSNIGLAIVLIFVGVLLYKEVITIKQIIGMAACAVGLILISK